MNISVLSVRETESGSLDVAATVQDVSDEDEPEKKVIFTVSIPGRFFKWRTYDTFETTHTGGIAAATFTLESGQAYLLTVRCGRKKIKRRF